MSFAAGGGGATVTRCDLKHVRRGGAVVGLSDCAVGGFVEVTCKSFVFLLAWWNGVVIVPLFTSYVDVFCLAPAMSWYFAGRSRFVPGGDAAKRGTC